MDLAELNKKAVPNQGCCIVRHVEFLLESIQKGFNFFSFRCIQRRKNRAVAGTSIFCTGILLREIHQDHFGVGVDQNLNVQRYGRGIFKAKYMIGMQNTDSVPLQSVQWMPVPMPLRSMPTAAI